MMDPSPRQAIDPPLKPVSLLKLLIAVTLVIAAAFIGQIATFKALGEWYPALKKPFFNPPNAVFGPVWSALYALMTLAFWRILRVPAGTPGRTEAILLFLTQLALNALWSVAFFALRSPALGLAVILLLIAAVFLTWRSFRRFDGLAAAVLIPYLAWISFAALLNAAILVLN